MDTFDTAFERTIGHEGGYVNDPTDRGGETKYGISRRAYPTLNIQALTLAEAKDIYRRDYWALCACNEMPPLLACAVFDLAVNAGRYAAVQDLQLALGLNNDGVLGPRTLAAIRALGHGIDDMRAAVRVHAAGLERRTNAPTWAHHGRGWARRVARNLLELGL